MGRRRRSKTTEPTPEQEELPLPESRLIDEMNIVETPFALLSQTTSLTRLDLTPNGDRYLVSSEAHLLPTALAEQVVLGLLWMHHEEGFESRKIRFSLRKLVTSYIYPGRFSASLRPNSKTMNSVREQLHRVAATRIYTDKWYDKELGYHTTMDAAIIDYVQIRQKGGKNKPEIIEIGWGEKFFESIKSKYTKDLDPSIYLKIDKPLDRRLFRWVDRQLASKSEQRLGSIQLFARSKLGMSGAVIDKGGRTASTYIAKNLKAAVERLNGIGFPVRLEIDTSSDDYPLSFSRKAEGPNEVKEVDAAGDLLHQFLVTFHGGTRRRKFATADRRFAEDWLEGYGVEASYWMIEEAKRIQVGRKAEVPLTFRGLGMYEDAAWGAWSKRAPSQAEDSPVSSESVRPTWDAYVEHVLKSRLPRISAEEELLRAKRITSRLQTEPAWAISGKATRQKWIAAEVRLEQIEACHVLSKAEYEALTIEELEITLRKRHSISLSDPA